MKKELIIYEFDCLYSILSTDENIITKIFSNIIIPQMVYDGFKNKLNENIQKAFNELVNMNFIILKDFEVESQEFKFYRKLVKGIECKSRGKYESMAITLAKSYNLTILSTNNNDYFKELDIETVTIADFILNRYYEDIITMDEAEILWNNIASYKKLVSHTFNQYLLLKNVTN